MAKKQSENISELLEGIVANHSKPNISIDDLLKAFGQRATDPLLFITALVLLSPIGGLPGATMVFGSFIVLLAGQSLFVDTPWMPQWLRKRKAPTTKAKRWIKKALPVLKKSERMMRARFTLITTGRWKHVSTVLILLLGVSTYVLGLIPGGLILPALAIGFLSMARLHNDGLLMGVGLLGGVSSMALLFYWVYDSTI